MSNSTEKCYSTLGDYNLNNIKRVIYPPINTTVAVPLFMNKFPHPMPNNVELSKICNAYNCYKECDCDNSYKIKNFCRNC